jgi:prolyl oligopeptidase PreP (S9A serine peptidase family)
VGLGYLRDTTHQAVVQRPEMFGTVPLDVPALDPKRNEFLKLHPGGPGT